MMMITTLLSTFLFAVVAQNATQYAVFETFANKSCALSTGRVSAYALDMCVLKTVVSTTSAGIITITTFGDEACTTTPTEQYSQQINTCGAYSKENTVAVSGMFTAVGLTRAQAQQGLDVVPGTPVIEIYKNSNCSGIIPLFEAEISSCVISGRTTGQTETCDMSQKPFPTITTCRYNGDITCKGPADCDATKKTAGSCNPVPTSNSLYGKYVCLAPDVSTTTPPNNNNTPGVSGGVIAAAVLVPLIVIAVSVVIFILVRKRIVMAQNTDHTEDGKVETSYGTV